MSRVTAGLALAAVAALAACGPWLRIGPQENGSTPSPPSAPSPSPGPTPTPSPSPSPGCTTAVSVTQSLACPASPAPAPGPTGLTVAGPAPFVAAGGKTLQLSARATAADGTATDMTGTATWSSSDPAVATVSPAGLVTSVAPGSATITASAGTAGGAVTLKVPGTVGTICTAGMVQNVVRRPKSTELWLVEANAHLEVVDLCTNRITTSVQLDIATDTGTLVFSPDGTNAYLSTPAGVEVYDSGARAHLLTVTAGNGGQLAVSPAGDALFVAYLGKTDVIYPPKNDVQLHDDRHKGPTGEAVLVNGKAYISDRYHDHLGGDGDSLYSFPTYVTAANAHEIRLGSYWAGSLYPSPAGDKLFASSGVPKGRSYVIDTANDAIEGKTVDGLGAWSFFADHKRVLWSPENEAAYSVFDYSGATIDQLDTIGVTPPATPCPGIGPCDPGNVGVDSMDRPATGLVGITEDQVLYLPAGGAAKLSVYQYY